MSDDGCRSGEYGEYGQQAMYIPVSGLYYQQDAQVFIHLISVLYIAETVGLPIVTGCTALAQI